MKIINFKKLQQLTIDKIKTVKPELFSRENKEVNSKNGK